MLQEHVDEREAEEEEQEESRREDERCVGVIGQLLKYIVNHIHSHFSLIISRHSPPSGHRRGSEPDSGRP